MRRIIALLSVMALMVAALAMPASAQPVFIGGLVNVTVVDVLNDNTVVAVVQVPVGIAANVCDVNAAVLANQVDTGDAECTAEADSQAEIDDIIARDR